MNRLILTVLCLVLAAGCDPNDAASEPTLQTVRTVAVREGRLNHRLSFHGVLVPVDRARLAFQSPGVVITRPAQMGQAVRRGELLATLDNPDLGPAQRAAAARLQETLAQRDQAKRELARQRSLSTTGAVGEETVEQREAELASLEAAVAQAEADLAGTRQRLEDATLLAPFDGVISSVIVEPGEFVSAGQAVMAIGGLEKVEVRVLLPASLVSELFIGKELMVSVPQLGENESTGRVTELSTIGEQDTGLFPVTVEIPVDPASSMIRAGMQAEVIVVYADVQGLIAPLGAIVDPVGGNPKLFRVDDGMVTEIPVRILAIAEGEVAVEALETRLDSGDQVIVAGHLSLTNGQQVRMIQ